MKLAAKLFFVLWLVTGFYFSGCKNKHSDYSEYIDTVACPVIPTVNKIKIAHPYYNKKVQLKTKLFYGANQYKTAWLKRNGPDKRFQAFADEVSESSGYGMNPGNYNLKLLKEQVKTLYDDPERTEAERSNLDIRITASFFLYTTHLIEGQIRFPGAPEFIWERGMPLENDIALLLTAKSSADLRKDIEALHPNDPQYKRLHEALTRYEELHNQDTFPPLSGKLQIKPGDDHKAIPLIRKKIELSEGKRIREASMLYDDDLVNGVKQFQKRHGLIADGIIRSETAEHLNIRMKHKLDLIALNLERLRWRPHTTADKNEVVINVPEYMLRVYNNNEVMLKMRVVLGTEYNATPVFQDTLKYLVFSPTWIVPQSIFANEFLPKLKENPAYFNNGRFRFYKSGDEIDPTLESWTDESLDTTLYHVIENPGPQNSLGNVKFIMPNDFSVYLHDTPASKLFGRETRALSHGCIRLEKPLDFASYLLRNKKGWNKKKIKEAMRSGNPLKVDLEKTFPVHIVYRTVWVDDDNLVNFRDDIYGHDKRQLAQLLKNKEYISLKSD